MKKKFNLVFSILTFFLSLLIIYVFVYVFYFINLDKDFKKNFKDYNSFSYYKKYSKIINHIRYKDEYRFKDMNYQLLFNYFKNDSDDKVILFQGDSWMQQMNYNKFTEDLLIKNLHKYTKIINSGTASYSPSLMHKQFDILEKEFKIYPNTVVAYIDQTDMGDELCRYKHLIKYDNSENLKNIGTEKYPYYRDVFNLHEKIVLSEIELKNESRLLKTQLYINYLIKKFIEKQKKKFFFTSKDGSRLKKCEWRLIENYKKEISDEDRTYLKNVFKNYFLYLIKKSYIENIYVVTHPHKEQLVSKNESIDISNIVSETIINLPKITHINFSEIIQKKNIYKNLENIWNEDKIHLDEKNYQIFLKKIIDEIN